MPKSSYKETFLIQTFVSLWHFYVGDVMEYFYGLLVSFTKMSVHSVSYSRHSARIHIGNLGNQSSIYHHNWWSPGWFEGACWESSSWSLRVRLLVWQGQTLSVHHAPSCCMTALARRRCDCQLRRTKLWQMQSKDPHSSATRVFW